MQVHSLTRDQHVRPDAPIDPPLCAWGRLYPAPGRFARHRVVNGDIALDRAQAAALVIFGKLPGSAEETLVVPFSHLEVQSG